MAAKSKAKPKAPSTDDLELTQAQAKKIVKLAIKHGAYSDDMPDTKKDQIEAARESVAMCIDGWVTDEVRPDDDDEEIADAAKAILELFELAGIEVDDDNEIVMPGEDDDDDDDTDDDEDSDDGDEDDDDGEAPFDPDDYFEDGWSELTASSKIKVLKALDTEDEDDLAAIEAVHSWEKEQDKPTSRVLSWIEDNFDMSDDDSDADDDADDDSDDDDDEPVDGEAEEMEEPWKGYDKLTAVDVKKFLNDADDLSAEQVQYVKEYEEAMKAPRKRILTLCDTLIEKLNEEDDEDEKPAKKGGALSSKRSKAKDPDDDDEVDEAVARDDAKDKRKRKAKKAASGYTVNFDVDDESIEISCDGMHAAAGTVLDALISGAESITVEAS